MAEETDDSQKTEEPSQRRLDDAHEKGDVVKSMELSSFVLLSGATLALAIFASTGAQQFMARFTMFLARPDQLDVDAGALDILKQSLLGLLAVVGPAIGLLMLFAVAGHLVQHRPVLTLEKIKPDLQKISPLSGFKRLFGWDGIATLIKGILKLIAVSAAAYAVLWPNRGVLGAALDMTPTGVTGLSMALIIKVLMAALCVLALIAAADYFYQRQRFMSRHRMSRQELKDELKQSEGDPLVKAKIRQVRQERSKRRMMAAVPKATVVIMNPTHYAVALSYESGKMAAPVCVAKGVDAVALRIREVAEEHDVPIVENPPLARALFAAIEIDDPIPADHYKAVAQVIGYVMRLANAKKYWN